MDIVQTRSSADSSKQIISIKVDGTVPTDLYFEHCRGVRHGQINLVNVILIQAAGLVK